MSSRTVNATETIKQSLHFILHFAGKQNCAFLFFPFSPPPPPFFFVFFFVLTRLTIFSGLLQKSSKNLRSLIKVNIVFCKDSPSAQLGVTFLSFSVIDHEPFQQN